MSIETDEGTGPRRPRVVIIGAGFGGLEAAKRLRRARVDITLIDKRNHHLFQPLLYQVATAGLSPSDIAWPIRSILAHQQNVRVVLGNVHAIDRARRVVHAEEHQYPFDYLVIATGARHSYFGKNEWEPYAPGLKQIVDATEIRRRVLIAFEHAEIEDDPSERRRQLTFLVVGGGPTGVEMAGAVAELARFALARDFRSIKPSSARIILCEAAERLLPGFHQSLSDYVHRALEGLGVEVMLGKRVAIDGEAGALIGDQVLPCATTIWAAGVEVPNVAGWLGVEAGPGGHVPVNEDLSVHGSPEIFVIGDAAKIPWRDGDVPGIAPAAKQGGRYVAQTIRDRCEGRAARGKFVYRHQGSLATIGRNAAAADFGRIRIKGRLAWWLWGIAHIYFLIGVRSPLLVSMQWLWSYVTYDKGARLITRDPPSFVLVKDHTDRPRAAE